MKSSKTGKEDYSKIIGQIDSLKDNISQLISVSQDTCRTVRMSDTKRTKSPLCRMKASRVDKRSTKKTTSRTNISSKKTDCSQISFPNKVWEKLIQVEKANKQIKNSHLILEEMLRIEREKRVHLERQLKSVIQNKKSAGVQTTTEFAFKQYTHQKASQRRKQSRIRDEGDVQSFLLGDCDEYVFSSPKKRNLAQIQIMELLHKVSKGGPQETKTRLLEAVKRFIKK